MGIPQLSAFTIFMFLGCGDAVKRIVQASFHLFRASPWRFVQSCRNLSCPTIQRPWPRQTPSSQRGLSLMIWCEGSIFCLELEWQLGNRLLKGKGPRRCWGRMEGWYIIFFILGWWPDCLTCWFQRAPEPLYLVPRTKCEQSRCAWSVQ